MNMFHLFIYSNVCLYACMSFCIRIIPDYWDLLKVDMTIFILNTMKSGFVAVYGVMMYMSDVSMEVIS